MINKELTCEWPRIPANGWGYDVRKQKWYIKNPHNDKKFQRENFDYAYCPYCGKRLLVR